MATTRTSARPSRSGSASSTSTAAKAASARKQPAAKEAAPAAKKAPATRKAPAVRKATAATPVVKKGVAVKKATPAVKKAVAVKKAAPTVKKAAATKGVAKKATPATRQATARKAATPRVPGAPRARPRRKAEPDAAARLHAVVRGAVEDLKARDITEIDVRGKSSVTDLMVIVSGTSSRHVKSIADEVVKKAKQAGMPPIGVEGQREAEWVLVDLGDIVVHVMLPRMREFYALERLWGVGGPEDSETESGMLAG